MKVRQLLSSISCRSTAIWARKWFPERVKVVNRRPTRIQRVLDVIDDVGDDALRSALTNFAGALFNIKLPPVKVAKKETTISQIEIMTAFVPLLNPNSHDYPLNEASLSMGSFSQCYRPNGSRGNSMSMQRNSLRPATPQEIDDLFKQFSRGVLDTIYDTVKVTLEIFGSLNDLEIKEDNPVTPIKPDPSQNQQAPDDEIRRIT